jgi:hypothetical protein
MLPGTRGEFSNLGLKAGFFVYFSAYNALPHPLLSSFLVDQGGSASCTCFPLLTLFFHVVNFDIVIFENDTFSTNLELFLVCTHSSNCLCQCKKFQTLILEKHH